MDHFIEKHACVVKRINHSKQKVSFIYIYIYISSFHFVTNKKKGKEKVFISGLARLHFQLGK